MDRGATSKTIKYYKIGFCGLRLWLFEPVLSIYFYFVFTFSMFSWIWEIFCLNIIYIFVKLLIFCGVVHILYVFRHSTFERKTNKIQHERCHHTKKSKHVGSKNKWTEIEKNNIAKETHVVGVSASNTKKFWFLLRFSLRCVLNVFKQKTIIKIMVFSNVNFVAICLVSVISNTILFFCCLLLR